MQAELFLALKDVLKDKKILLMIILVIGIGVTASLVMSGLFNGFSVYFRDVTVNVMTGHLTIFPGENEEYITNLKTVERKIGLLPEVTGVSPRLAANAIAVRENEESQVRITGLVPSKEIKTTKLAEKVVEGEFLSDNDDGALLGRILAENLKVKTGERIRITFRNGAVREYKVKGLVDTGARAGDDVSVYLTNKNIESALGMEDSASQIFIRLSDIGLADKSKVDIIQLGIDGDIKTWKEMSAYVEQITGNFNFIFGMINFISLVASAVSVSVVMFINVEHKTREIGILKAIGARNSFVTSVFLIEILIYAAFGSLAGNALGWMFTQYLQAFPAVRFGTGGVSIAIVPLMTLSDMAKATMTVFFVTVVAGMYPVRMATKMDVIKAIWGGG